MTDLVDKLYTGEQQPESSDAPAPENPAISMGRKAALEVIGILHRDRIAALTVHHLLVESGIYLPGLNTETSRFPVRLGVSATRAAGTSSLYERMNNAFVAYRDGEQTSREGSGALGELVRQHTGGVGQI